MDVFELARGNLFSFAFEVGDLAGDQLKGAGGPGQLEHQVPGVIARRGLGLDNNLKSLRQQSVARQNRDALAEHLVIGELAPAIVVIIHGRQVIVDQGVSMNALHGASHGQGGGGPASASGGGGEAQRRAQAFAAGEKGIPHGFVNGNRLARRRRKKPVQGGIHRLCAGGEETRHIERGRLSRVQNTDFGCWHGRFLRKVLTRSKRRLGTILPTRRGIR